MGDKPIHILLIEDNPGDARLIREFLAENGGGGFHLEWAERLEEGLRHLDAGHVDLVLLDLSLPQSAGLDTLAVVLGHAPRIPTVVLTALDDVAVAVEAVRRGAQDYLVKSQIDSRLLVRAVRYAIERKQIGEALRQANVRLRESQEVAADEAMQRRILVEQSRDGIVVLDQNGKVYEANRIYAEMLGYSPEEVRQLHVWDWDCQWTQEQLLDRLQRVNDTGDHFETQHRRKDGTIIDVEISTNGAVMAGQKLVFCVCRDVTDRKRAEEALQQANTRLEELATTDELTGLANRRRFLEAIGLEMERARRYGSDFALAMIDVDGFKAINDACGHVFGDRVLVEVAKALKDGARATDVVARYGGDEFIVLIPNTGTRKAVSAIERFRRRIAGRVISDGKRSLEVSISAGVSALDSEDRTAGPDILIRQADEALYAAKHGGGNVTKTWNEIARDRTEGGTDEAARVGDLRREVAGLSLQAKEMVVQSIGGLVHALEARDPYTEAHSANVTRYAVAIAETLELAPEETAVIRRAAMVHDIGKIAVPDGILRKPGPLDDHERRIMQRHVLAGVKIIDQMHFLERETPIVRHHHEHWDGKGYPDGISGEAIPLGARILAVADAFDAITSNRVYHNARSVSDALQVLIEESGRQFNARVVDATVKWVLAIGRKLGKESDLTVADLQQSQPALVPV